MTLETAAASKMRSKKHPQVSFMIHEDELAHLKAYCSSEGLNQAVVMRSLIRQLNVPGTGTMGSFIKGAKDV